MVMPELPGAAVPDGLFDKFIYLMTGPQRPAACSSTKFQRGLTHNLRRDPICLPKPMLDWLGCMADVHNCCSRNKTLRDLLCLYVTFSDADLKRVLDAGKAKKRSLEAEEKSALDIHITRHHTEWLASVAEKYSLSVSIAVFYLLEFAKEELNEEYVFETHVSCARTTAELYSDCDIFSSLS